MLAKINYPENLNHLWVFIINAPTVVPILWSIVLKTLSERTKSKISLTGHDNREGLREFLSDETIDRMFAMWIFPQHTIYPLYKIVYILNHLYVY